MSGLEDFLGVMAQSESGDWNDEELLAAIIGRWKENWFTGYEYTGKDPERFTGAPLPFDRMQSAGMLAAGTYVGNLFTACHGHNYELVEHELAMKEVLQSDREGGLCIYISVLLRALLIKMGVAPAADVQLVQGYYKHALREDFPFEWGKFHSGLHAWVAVGDSVLDCSIGQEEMFFDFKDKPFIFGPVPEGLELVGYRELSRVADRYARRYAKRAGLTIDVWAQKHAVAAIEYAKKGLADA